MSDKDMERMAQRMLDKVGSGLCAIHKDPWLREWFSKPRVYRDDFPPEGHTGLWTLTLSKTDFKEKQE